METELKATYHRLQDVIRSLGSAVIAFSGGVDSSLLLKVSQETLPGRILAVTARSATTPAHELAEAASLARRVGGPAPGHRLGRAHLAGISQQSPGQMLYL